MNVAAIFVCVVAGHVHPKLNRALLMIAPHRLYRVRRICDRCGRAFTAHSFTYEPDEQVPA